MAAGLGKFHWREYAVERVKVLSALKMSSSQIAAKLSAEWRTTITRNMIIGATRRNGVKLALPVCARLPGTRNERRRMVYAVSRGRPAPTWPVEPPPAPSIDPFIGIEIVDLKPDSCRWPHGDPALPSFRYCGASAAEGKPYCPYHCGLAYERRAA